MLTVSRNASSLSSISIIRTMTHFRLAVKQDNEQLIELTGTSPMQGKTSLRIDSNPDFFQLLNMRGKSKVFIAVNDHTIVGSLCVSSQQVYINKQIFPVHYIGDFKVAPAFRGTGIGIQLCNELEKYLLSTDADLVFLTVAKGNHKPFPFFKGRTGIPDFENIGTFIVHQFIGINKKGIDAGNEIEQTDADDEVIEFLNNHYSTYELGSVITKKKLEDAEIFIIRKKNKITAALCLIDTMNAKQNVVIKMSLRDKFLIRIINAMHQPLGISKMPAINEAIRMIYIKYLAANANEKRLVKLLINYARKIAYDKSYSFISLGLHEKDALNKCLPGFPKFTFHANGMFLSMKNNRSLIEKVMKGIPFEDFSLV